MEVRVDDEVDLGRNAVDRFETGADLLARVKIEFEQRGGARADAAGSVVLAIGMHAGVEQCGTLRVLDQIGRDRQPDPALAAFHQSAEIAGKVAAGEGMKLEV